MTDERTCPVCWTLLPSAVMHTLREQRTRLELDPGNAWQQSSFCAAHSFEITHKPRALQRGWPLSVDFYALPDRVIQILLRPDIHVILDTPQTSSFFASAAKGDANISSGA
jgi:hypothetical protein